MEIAACVICKTSMQATTYPSAETRINSQQHIKVRINKLPTKLEK